MVELPPALGVGGKITIHVLKSAVATSALIAFTALAGCGSNPQPPVACGGTSTLAASGSSAQAEAMTEFNASYSRACRGHSVVYRSNGSAAGRTEFIAGQSDFAGTDSPLGHAPGDAEKAWVRCGGSEAWNVPMVFGAIAIVYNLATVDSLVLDATTAAKIFNGSIRAWDAPEIAALNPGRDLPSTPVVVISRSDESGTTQSFQDYLGAAAGSAWGKGAGEIFNGASTTTAKGNEGAWSAMRRSPGSITYTAWPFAKRNALPTASILTSAGSEPVTLSVESVSKSLAGMSIENPGNDLVLDTSALHVPTEAGAYPIVMTTYETVCSRYPDPEVGAAVRSFLTVTLEDGQSDLSDNGYVPVPESLKDRLRVAISAIS